MKQQCVWCKWVLIGMIIDREFGRIAINDMTDPLLAHPATSTLHFCASFFMLVLANSQSCQPLAMGFVVKVLKDKRKVLQALWLKGSAYITENNDIQINHDLDYEGKRQKKHSNSPIHKLKINKTFFDEKMPNVIYKIEFDYFSCFFIQHCQQFSSRVRFLLIRSR